MSISRDGAWLASTNNAMKCNVLKVLVYVQTSWISFESQYLISCIVPKNLWAVHKKFMILCTVLVFSGLFSTKSEWGKWLRISFKDSKKRNGSADLRSLNLCINSPWAWLTTKKVKVARILSETAQKIIRWLTPIVVSSCYTFKLITSM